MKISLTVKQVELTQTALTKSVRSMAFGPLLVSLIMLGPAVPNEAALLPPDGLVATVPGTANPPNALLTGTVLADMTVPFANGGVAPVNPAPGQAPVSIVFRGTNASVPFYLLSRYTNQGATVGALPNLPPPAFTGTLRTVVVRESIGGTLDFYLQVANTSPGGTEPGEPNDIFRISAGGFNASGFAGDALDVFYRTDGTAADVIPGATLSLAGDPGDAVPKTADRLASNNQDIGFDFDFNPGGGNSIFDVDGGRFLLIRTNAMAFGPSTVTVSSTGTAYVSSFAPIAVPEPVSLYLAVAAVAAPLVSWRRRRTQSIRAAA